MGEVNTRASNVRLVGERTCLDFVNTVDSFAKDEPKEYWRTYSDLVAWSEHAGVVPPHVAQRLADAAQSPSANAVLKRAVALRGALYGIFTAIVAGDKPLPDHIALLNNELARAPLRFQVAVDDNGVSWSWREAHDALDQMLWPVVWSAADVLTSAEAALIRQCAGEGCTWMFLDTSRSGTRRWCSMDDCGNRAKARRHYERRKNEA